MTPGTARTLGRAIRLAPAIVLILVAAIQWVLASTVPVSPWVGGGFGMFATVDGVHRVVTVDGAPVRSEGARRYAAAPFAGADESLDVAADQRLLVWAPRYDKDSGLLDFEIIAARTAR